MVRRPPQGGRGLKYLLRRQQSELSNGRPPQGGRGLKYARGLLLVVFRVSPSARRAWVEIHTEQPQHTRHTVALRKEGVG